MKKLFNILLLALLLFSLFGCEVEPYEPACVQGEYIHDIYVPKNMHQFVHQMVQHMQMFVMLSKMVGKQDV